MTAITDIFAREIMDSRGIQLWKLMLPLKQGLLRTCCCSIGRIDWCAQAVELRDGQADRFGGKGVHQACENVNGEIFETLSGLDAEDQVHIDHHAGSGRHRQQEPVGR